MTFSMTMEQTESTTAALTSLPTELLLFVFSFLDDTSLVELGNTCRFLNTEALTAFLKRTGHFKFGDERRPEQRLSYSADLSPDILTALRCAIFAKSITQITYRIPGTTLQRVVQDMHDIRRIVERQPKVMGVSLFMWQVDNKIKQSGGRSFSQGYPITLEKWSKIACEAFTAIINKGCESLDLQSGARLVDPLLFQEQNCPIISTPSSQESPVTIQASERSRTRKILSKIAAPFTVKKKSKSITEPTSVSTDTPRPVEQLRLKSSLREAQLRSDMLFSPTFIYWTTSLLHASSSTLTTLTIECKTTPVHTWHVLLRSVHLTRLRFLKIKVSELLVERTLDIAPDDLIHFLSCHLNIEEATLYGLTPGTPSDHLRGLRMPALRSFVAHPCYVTWLLNLPAVQLPRLDRVIASTEYYTRQPFNHTLLDFALEALAANPRRIVFGVRFKIFEGMSDWMNARSNGPNEGNHVVHRLTTIERLEVALSWYMEFDEELLNILAMFVNAFPSASEITLTELNIDVQVWDADKLKEFFGARCARVRTLKVNDMPMVHIQGDGPPLSRSAAPQPSSC
ncbi:hypothetical protein FA15DRAFT_760978 [Coprinopsis marcescibilis]|uniref:F-box domain-containing protein n=1 Tax=Coprinopsis marcescibilis TaxID=230819 RepID=A0A5C3KCG9_COPMA|nr:hypothetical protein FA15DRAFT_760978 [Coprinopsis marcescibilis]